MKFANLIILDVVSIEQRMLAFNNNLIVQLTQQLQAVINQQLDYVLQVQILILLVWQHQQLQPAMQYF